MLQKTHWQVCLCRKDLQTKNCGGSAAMGVMKLCLTKKCFILSLDPSAELPLNTSSIRQGWTSGGFADTHCKARLLGVQTMSGCPVCPQLLHCPQQPLCTEALPVMGSTLLKEGPVQPDPFLSQLLWLAACLYHLLCMVVIRTNYSCMVHAELAVKVTAASMRLVTIWPVWRVNTLTVYWGCLSVMSHVEQSTGLDSFVLLWQLQQSAFGSSENKIWPVWISVRLTFSWKGKSSWNNPDPVLPFKFIFCWLHFSAWESPVSSGLISLQC